VDRPSGPLARSLTVTPVPDHAQDHPDQHRTQQPPPFTPVRLGPDDLRDLYDFLAVCDTAVVGHADITEDELAADLRNPVVESYGWRDETGRMVGHGYAERIGDSDKVIIDVYVHPDHPDQDLGHAVLHFLEERGRAAVAAGGLDTVYFDMGTYRQDLQTQAWLRAGGYTSETSFERMRVDLDGPVDVPPLPDGLTVRRSDLSEDELRTGHRIDDESFGEHYGHVPVDLELWSHRLSEHGEDFSQLWLAELDGRPVGVLVGNKRFKQEDDAGYVSTLATLPSARGRGVGKALLRAYFASEQQAGRVAVLLHVDVANVTGALAIYESVGMRPVESILAWSKREPLPPRDGSA
jgi:ribosomal protein S18 acetylase RimI-like enzyme